MNRRQALTTLAAIVAAPAVVAPAAPLPTRPRDVDVLIADFYILTRDGGADVGSVLFNMQDAADQLPRDQQAEWQRSTSRYRKP